MGDYVNKLLNQYADDDFAGDDLKSNVIKDINIRLSNLENILLGNNMFFNRFKRKIIFL